MVRVRCFLSLMVIVAPGIGIVSSSSMGFAERRHEMPRATVHTQLLDGVCRELQQLDNHGSGSWHEHSQEPDDDYPARHGISPRVGSGSGDDLRTLVNN
jgi:hypothetical protein